MDVNKITEILQNDCHLNKAFPLIVGVSGGPDSLCLMDVLYHAGYAIIIVHFNHKLRAEADSDAEHVAATAALYRLPCITLSGDVAGFALEKHMTIEEAAREARYGCLFEQARIFKAQAVAVGHTADDQAETVLMHLLRGAGLSGLSGMQPSNILPTWDASIPLVRPLLGVTHAETQTYCREHNLNPVLDASNLDPTYSRNRLRLELIPTLEGYNPNIRRLLAQTASVLAADEALISPQVDEVWQTCLLEYNSDSVSLSRSVLLASPLGMQRRLTRMAIAELRPGLRDIDFDAVDLAVRTILNPPRTHHVELPTGIQMDVDEMRVVFWKGETPPLAVNGPQMGSEEIHFTPPGEIELASGWRLAGEKIILQGNRPWADSPPDPFQAWLDASAVSLPFILRRMAPGDRFSPLGMTTGSTKISDYWTNKKLPRRARKTWPLVLVGDKIAWVPGYCPAEEYKINENCREAYHLRIYPLRPV